MRLGSQTITVVTVAEDLTTRDAFNNPAEVRSETLVRGCLVRPLPAAKEVTTDGGDRTTESLRVTAPPVPATLAATSRDEVTYQGSTYQIQGVPAVHRDLAGKASHVTITVERHLG